MKGVRNSRGVLIRLATRGWQYDALRHTVGDVSKVVHVIATDRYE